MVRVFGSHQRRIYCSNSCNTRAYNARQVVKKVGLATSLQEVDSSDVPYSQPRKRWLLWRVVPGKQVALLSPAYLDALAEQASYEAKAPLRLGVAQARPLQPKFLG